MWKEVNNSMEQSPLEKITAQLVDKFPAFLEPEGSLPHSQETSTCTHLEPDKSSTHPFPSCFSLMIPGQIEKRF
jgi:hypothetical protein